MKGYDWTIESSSDVITSPLPAGDKGASFTALLTAMVLAFLLIMGASISVWASSGPPPGPGDHNRLPPEAIQACQGKSEGDAVQFTTPKGDTIQATCREINGQLAAVPDDGPPPENKNYGPGAIVDTGQRACYDDNVRIKCPQAGDSFFGQDAQYFGARPDYTDNGNGTVTDNVTGLVWQQSPDINGDGVIDSKDKLTFSDAQDYVAALNAAKYGGYSDWRLPSIKELYSLINFSGTDPGIGQGGQGGQGNVSGGQTGPGNGAGIGSGGQAGLSGAPGSGAGGQGQGGSGVGPDGQAGPGGNSQGLRPFIDTRYFGFGYGDVSAGERLIDAQFVSSTLYVSTTMNGNKTVFGVNFADGRIKGYPVDKTFYVLCVRGNAYGVNKFVDNGDGTISDQASGLMWSKEDSGEGMNWESALSWVAEKNSEDYLGYSDWRLPNAKELQSIVDYTRSPDTTDSAAIDPVFDSTSITNEGGQQDYPYYWTGTTHANSNGMGDCAVYVAFGRALGWMQDAQGNYQLMDVHGAGAQRCDPKAGNPADYPHGRGPQGDVIRIYNYVRLVRDINSQ